MNDALDEEVSSPRQVLVRAMVGPATARKPPSRQRGPDSDASQPLSPGGAQGQPRMHGGREALDAVVALVADDSVPSEQRSLLLPSAQELLIAAAASAKGLPLGVLASVAKAAASQARPIRVQAVQLLHALLTSDPMADALIDLPQVVPSAARALAESLLSLNLVPVLAKTLLDLPTTSNDFLLGMHALQMLTRAASGRCQEQTFQDDSFRGVIRKALGAREECAAREGRLAAVRAVNVEMPDACARHVATLLCDLPLVHAFVEVAESLAAASRHWELQRLLHLSRRLGALDEHIEGQFRGQVWLSAVSGLFACQSVQVRVQAMYIVHWATQTAGRSGAATKSVPSQVTLHAIVAGLLRTLDELSGAPFLVCLALLADVSAGHVRERRLLAASDALLASLCRLLQSEHAVSESAACRNALVILQNLAAMPEGSERLQACGVLDVLLSLLEACVKEQAQRVGTDLLKEKREQQSAAAAAVRLRELVAKRSESANRTPTSLLLAEMADANQDIDEFLLGTAAGGASSAPSEGSAASPDDEAESTPYYVLVLLAMLTLTDALKEQVLRRLYGLIEQLFEGPSMAVTVATAQLLSCILHQNSWTNKSKYLAVLTPSGAHGLMKLVLNTAKKLHHEHVSRMLSLLLDIYDVSPMVWHQMMGSKEAERQIMCWLSTPGFSCVGSLMRILDLMLLYPQNLQVLQQPWISKPLVRCVLRDQATLDAGTPVLRALLASGKVTAELESYGLSPALLLRRVSTSASDAESLPFFRVLALLLRSEAADSPAVVDTLPFAVKCIANACKEHDGDVGAEDEPQRSVAFALAEVAAAVLMCAAMKPGNARVLKFLKRRQSVAALLRGLRQRASSNLLCSCLVTASVLCEHEELRNEFVELQLLNVLAAILVVPALWLLDYLTEHSRQAVPAAEVRTPSAGHVTSLSLAPNSSVSSERNTVPELPAQRLAGLSCDHNSASDSPAPSSLAQPQPFPRKFSNSVGTWSERRSDLSSDDGLGIALGAPPRDRQPEEDTFFKRSVSFGGPAASSELAAPSGSRAKPARFGKQRSAGFVFKPAVMVPTTVAEDYEGPFDDAAGDDHLLPPFDAAFKAESPITRVSISRDSVQRSSMSQLGFSSLETSCEGSLDSQKQLSIVVDRHSARDASQFSKAKSVLMDPDAVQLPARYLCGAISVRLVEQLVLADDSISPMVIKLGVVQKLIPYLLIPSLAPHVITVLKAAIAAIEGARAAMAIRLVSEALEAQIRRIVAHATRNGCPTPYQMLWLLKDPQENTAGNQAAGNVSDWLTSSVHDEITEAEDQSQQRPANGPTTAQGLSTPVASSSDQPRPPQTPPKRVESAALAVTFRMDA